MFVSRSGSRLAGIYGRKTYPRTLTKSLSGQTNPPLNLDPTLQSFLNSEDITLHGKKSEGRNVKHLEVLSHEGAPDREALVEVQEAEQLHSSERKSPAALYGSHHIGAVILPNQLQNAINLMITESDRPQLHQDAKRLFQEENGIAGEDWSSRYDTSYRSRSQAARFAERDASAFASVALPAHYSAILAVFDHLKRRLERDWKVTRVIDWGAGTGSGLWASLHAFQRPSEEATSDGIPGKEVANSTITSYLGIDKRDGLVAIGKRLLRGIDLGKIRPSWQKTWHEEDVISVEDGQDVIALSAFALSSLPTDLARKQLVKEMWQSGAQTIVLIDHSTPQGFENIAGARQLLLDLGAKETRNESEVGNLSGCHVVAPCPHDKACPLMHNGSSQLVCGFSQRMQRPAFVRKTKHSKIGHEDVDYSYVVIRRGPRPMAVQKNTGRIGEVGRRELHKEAMANVQMKELLLQSEFEEAPGRESIEDVDPIPGPLEHVSEQLAENLRLEAFDWPRLVFPPLKKSGHVILDSCTTEGKIMRLIIPKSQGKQEYYDARKASWGDMFPHPPKNTPVQRLISQKNGSTSVKAGADIGKRGNEDKKNNKERTTYEAISRALKEQKRQQRRDRMSKV